MSDAAVILRAITSLRLALRSAEGDQRKAIKKTIYLLTEELQVLTSIAPSPASEDHNAPEPRD